MQLSDIKKAVFWFYNNYCYRHPVMAESILLVLIMILVHIGYTYVRQNASKVIVDTKAILPLKGQNGSAIANGDCSVAISGTNNAVENQNCKVETSSQQRGIK